MRNKIIMGACVAAVVLLIMWLLQNYAAAQETRETFLQSLENPIMEIVSMVIAAALLLVTNWLRMFIGINIEAKHREALQSALENAARLVLQTALDKDTGGKKMKDVTLEIGDAAMEAGIDYVKQSVPDAVRKFGLDDFLIDKLLRPKLMPKIGDIVSGAAAGSKVIVQPGK